MFTEKIRGTVDIYGEEFNLFEDIVNKVRKISLKYCFSEIILPIMENKEVFYRTLGETSDIVSKETYTFLDKGERYITLRPEFTASVIRAILSNNMLQSLPLKLFTHGPLFRHERPQKCRLRQFNQINFEYIGTDNINADIEVLFLAQDIINSLGIKDNIVLNINSLGSTKSRAKFEEEFKNYLYKYKNDLSEASKIRLEKNPIRILDSKDENDIKILKESPKIQNFIDDESKKNLEYIEYCLQQKKINYRYINTLVRGLDYYSGFVFEFTTNALGAQNAIIAGGRYNNLVKQMGGKDTPAIGFAGGIERMLELTKKQFKSKNIPPIYLIPLGNKAENWGVDFAHKLRNYIQRPVMLNFGFSVKKHMQRANKLLSPYVVIFGENELNSNSVKVKNMKTGVEKNITLENSINYIDSLL